MNYDLSTREGRINTCANGWNTQYMSAWRVRMQDNGFTPEEIRDAAKLAEARSEARAIKRSISGDPAYGSWPEPFDEDKAIIAYASEDVSKRTFNRHLGINPLWTDAAAVLASFADHQPQPLPTEEESDMERARR